LSLSFCLQGAQLGQLALQFIDAVLQLVGDCRPEGRQLGFAVNVEKLAAAVADAVADDVARMAVAAEEADDDDLARAGIAGAVLCRRDRLYGTSLHVPIQLAVRLRQHRRGRCRRLQARHAFRADAADDAVEDDAGGIAFVPERAAAERA